MDKLFQKCPVDSIVRTGAAFAGDHLDLLTYNPRNELLTSTRYDDTDVETPSDPDPNFNVAYFYDSIGNRRDKDPETWEAGSKITEYDGDYEDYITVDRYYDTNSLNQYDKVRQLSSLPSHKAYSQDLSKQEAIVSHLNPANDISQKQKLVRTVHRPPGTICAKWQSQARRPSQRLE